MIFDTNLLINVVRQNLSASNRLVIPIIVVGELKAFALKSDWEVQKVNRMKHLFATYPIANITLPITRLYAQIDAFSQRKLQETHSNLPPATWVKRSLDCRHSVVPGYGLHITDNDFDHLPALGLRLVKH